MFTKTWFEPLEDLAAGIAARNGCSIEEARAVALELLDLDPTLQPAFRTWWETGEVPADCVAHGYTPKKFIDRGFCTTVPVAFTWMNGLVKRPKQAKWLMRQGRDHLRPSPREWLREVAKEDG